jgi:hypothetical protein
VSGGGLQHEPVHARAQITQCEIIDRAGQDLWMMVRVR